MLIKQAFEDKYYLLIYSYNIFIKYRFIAVIVGIIMNYIMHTLQDMDEYT